jgi:hypothetical protein
VIPPLLSSLLTNDMIQFSVSYIRHFGAWDKQARDDISVAFGSQAGLQDSHGFAGFLGFSQIMI